MTAMMAKMMSTSPGTSSSLSTPKTTSTSTPPPASLPVRTIPGGYGWPLLGPLSDRLNYFWFQGPETFFRKRIEKHKSTVFRTNMPPTFPFFTVNPNVVAVLDCKSFSHMFDMEIVEKKNVLVGDFMPSVSFTGDIRVCAYLDTSEPRHSQIKNFSLDILKRSSTIWVPTLTSKLDTMWDTLESQLSTSTSGASYLVPIQQFSFSFFLRCLVGVDPESSPEIAESGYAMVDIWLALQLLPTVNVGVLQPLVEIFLHSFAYPFFLVSRDYKKLYEFIDREGKEAIQRGETEFKLSKADTIHNLLFILGFNAFGGFSIFFPTLLSTLGSDTTGLQEKLRKEVREKCGSGLSFESVKEMELVQSFVYETLRLNPPVPLQFARARKDFKLSSHDSVFDVKKGELLCGYQPLVMRDPKIFDDPEAFVSDRFTKEKGRELLNYLYWSNGPQTGSPSESNKQCSAKDYVTLTACLFVAHLFLRYDSITCSSGAITAVEKVSK